MPIEKDKKVLKDNTPHIVVGTPGRILGLVRAKALNLKQVKHFVLDECDKMLDALGKFITFYLLLHFNLATSQMDDIGV